MEGYNPQVNMENSLQTIITTPSGMGRKGTLKEVLRFCQWMTKSRKLYPSRRVVLMTTHRNIMIYNLLCSQENIV